MMSGDANPAVRAWAARAAWNWWLWNSPTRKRLNQAYLTMLQTPEPSLLAENAKRYQLQALLIVNGNRSAANYDNPYTELADLLAAVEPLLDSDAADLVSRRLTGVAATYHSASYGSNGTGQLGYATPGASQAIGRSIARFWQAAEAAGDEQAIQLSVEGAANVIHEGCSVSCSTIRSKAPRSCGRSQPARCQIRGRSSFRPRRNLSAR
jgi:hypothetical protein